MTDSHHQSGRPVRIGLQLQPQHADIGDLRRALVAAEELGVDIVFNWDDILTKVCTAARF
jgi:hypothetical protein